MKKLLTFVLLLSLTQNSFSAEQDPLTAGLNRLGIKDAQDIEQLQRNHDVSLMLEMLDEPNMTKEYFTNMFLTKPTTSSSSSNANSQSPRTLGAMFRGFVKTFWKSDEGASSADPMPIKLGQNPFNLSAQPAPTPTQNPIAVQPIPGAKPYVKRPIDNNSILPASAQPAPTPDPSFYPFHIPGAQPAPRPIPTYLPAAHVHSSPVPTLPVAPKPTQNPIAIQPAPSFNPAHIPGAKPSVSKPIGTTMFPKNAPVAHQTPYLPQQTTIEKIRAAEARRQEEKKLQEEFEAYQRKAAKIVHPISLDETIKISSKLVWVGSSKTPTPEQKRIAEELKQKEQIQREENEAYQREAAKIVHLVSPKGIIMPSKLIPVLKKESSQKSTSTESDQFDEVTLVPVDELFLDQEPFPIDDEIKSTTSQTSSDKYDGVTLLSLEKTRIFNPQDYSSYNIGAAPADDAAVPPAITKEENKDK